MGCFAVTFFRDLFGFDIFPPLWDDPFPAPRFDASREPCGECHIQPGETCDICGASPLPRFAPPAAEPIDPARAPGEPAQARGDPLAAFGRPRLR